MGKGDGHGVSGIRWRGFVETKKRSNHKSDLIFVSGSFANDRFFNLLGGILVNFKAKAGSSN
jgi:hypothetical protein